MITSLRISNFKAFNDEVELSLDADIKSKKFFTNYQSYNEYNILKTLGIYGKNNVGKTCLINAAKTIKNVLLNKNTDIKTNIFLNNTIASLGVSFITDLKGYSFDFKYDTKTNEFIYEKYATFDTTKKDKEKTLILKDCINNIYKCENLEFEKLLPNLSNDNIILYTAKTNSFDNIENIKNIYIDFASKIYILNMVNIPITQTLEEMKKKDENAKEIVEFIKKADLEINNFEFNENVVIEFEDQKNNSKSLPEEKLFRTPEMMDLLKLVTYHKNKAVPFVLFDSTGTKKIAAVASYIIKNIKNGGTLFIDELDSGLHFKLSRAIIAMYNNLSNTNGQLIFTTHDINLMDCKKLLRKEQIWFADKDSERTYLYSLNDFKTRDGVRSGVTDVNDLYKRGMIANLPEPDLISWLLGVKNEK